MNGHTLRQISHESELIYTCKGYIMFKWQVDFFLKDKQQQQTFLFYYAYYLFRSTIIVLLEFLPKPTQNVFL